MATSPLVDAVSNLHLRLERMLEKVKPVGDADRSTKERKETIGGKQYTLASETVRFGRDEDTSYSLTVTKDSNKLVFKYGESIAWLTNNGKVLISETEQPTGENAQKVTKALEVLLADLMTIQEPSDPPDDRGDLGWLAQ